MASYPTIALKHVSRDGSGRCQLTFDCKASFDACFLLLHSQYAIAVHPARKSANFGSQAPLAGGSLQFVPDLSLESQFAASLAAIFGENTVLKTAKRAQTPLWHSQDVTGRASGMEGLEKPSLPLQLDHNLQNKPASPQNAPLLPINGSYTARGGTLAFLHQDRAVCDRSSSLCLKPAETSPQSSREKPQNGHSQKPWAPPQDPGPADRLRNLQRVSNARESPSSGGNNLAFREAGLVQHTIGVASHAEGYSADSNHRNATLALYSQNRMIHAARDRNRPVTTATGVSTFSAVARRRSVAGLDSPDHRHKTAPRLLCGRGRHANMLVNRLTRASSPKPTLMLHVPDDELKEEIVRRLRDKAFVQFVDRLNRVLP